MNGTEERGRNWCAARLVPALTAFLLVLAELGGADILRAASAGDAAPPGLRPARSVLARSALQRERLDAMLRFPRRDFSSLQCTAGSQRFVDPLHAPHKALHGVDTDDASLRLCMLRNVCLVNNKLTLYIDPAEKASLPPDMLASAFAPTGLVYANFLDTVSRQGLAFDAVLGARPATSPPDAANDRIYVLDAFTYPTNYAHLLEDTVVPAYAAAEVLGLSVDDMQLFGLYSCTENTVPEQILPLSQRSLTEGCIANFESWYPLLFRTPYVPRPQEPAGHNVCFRHLVAGQNAMFSFAGTFPHQASVSRHMRINLFESLGIPHDEPPARHSIVVLQKLPDWAMIEYPEMCDDISTWARELDATIPVKCIVPASMNISSQMRLLRGATVVVSEHGSTSYSGHFHSPGSSFLIVYTRNASFKVIKEASRALFWADLHVTFFEQQRLREEHGRTGRAVLAKAINNAAESLALNRVKFVSAELS